MITAYIGLGANLGDAQATIKAALIRIANLPDSRLLAASSLYRSAPIEASGDDYVNAVACLATHMPADRLLAALQALENEYGRLRPYQNAPRTLDLDILLYGTEKITHPYLSIPHPRMHERAFVLRPLLELAPNLQIPDFPPLADLLTSVAHQSIHRLASTE